MQEFERQLEANLFELQAELTAGTYQHGPYIPFTIFDPKQRQIHKSTVRDRVVHQLLVDVIEPVFERRFIYDSFSCQRGKGTHAGVARLQQLLRRASRNNTRTVYALKCDVKKFFASVDHGLLKELLARRVADPQLQMLAGVVIDGFAASSGKGLPLGNLTSQLFANVYLHELDRFVKQELREPYYLRYCDDFIVLSADRTHLQQLTGRIKQFLLDELQLDLHPNKVHLTTWHQGVDFLGYVVKPDCVLLRPTTRRRIIARLTTANQASYLGVCGHANSYQLRQFIATKAWELEYAH